MTDAEALRQLALLRAELVGADDRRYVEAISVAVGKFAAPKKATPRCVSSDAGVRCQLTSDHTSPHYYGDFDYGF